MVNKSVKKNAHLTIARSNMSRYGYTTITLEATEGLYLKLVDPRERVHDRLVMARMIGGHAKYRLILKEGDIIVIRKPLNQHVTGVRLTEDMQYVFKDNQLEQIPYDPEVTLRATRLTMNSVNTAIQTTFTLMQDCLFGRVTKQRVIVRGTGLPSVKFRSMKNDTFYRVANPHDAYYGFKRKAGITIPLTLDDWDIERFEYEDDLSRFEIVAVAEQVLGSITLYGDSVPCINLFVSSMVDAFAKRGIEYSEYNIHDGPMMCYKPLVFVEGIDG